MVVVDDDRQLCSTIAECIPGYSYRFHHDFIQPTVEVFYDADLIVIDEQLPSGSGIKMVQELRKENIKTPILFITARATKDLAIQCINFGVAHFLEKPFSIEQLGNAVEKIITSSHMVDLSHEFFLDTDRKLVLYKNKSLGLTATEYKIIETLVINKSRCIGKLEMIQVVWGHGCHMSGNTVDTHLYNMRKKYPDLMDRVHNVRNRGYFWQEEGSNEKFEF